MNAGVTDQAEATLDASRAAALIARQRELDAQADLRDAMVEFRVQDTLRRKLREDIEKRANAPHLASRVASNLETLADRVAWVHESAENVTAGFIDSGAPAAEFAARIARAEAAFLEDAEENTGMEMSVEEYSARAERRLTLSEMTREIARRAEIAGVPMKRNDGFSLWSYAIHSETLELLECYRRVCFLPTIAARVRANVIASLEYFIQRNRWLRFWTFTTGVRCFAQEIPARLDWAFTRLRKLNTTIRKRWGVSILLRVVELGTIKDTADEGGKITFALTSDGILAPTYHPHFHLMVESTRGYLPPEEWTACCEYVRRFWSHHCDFTGGKRGAVIGGAREFVKYITKPGEVMKLAPCEIRDLFEATHNRRMIRPLGRLAKEIATRKAAGMTLRRKRTPAGWRWREVEDHNKTAASQRDEDEKRLAALIEAESDKDEAADFRDETDAAGSVSRLAPIIDRETARGLAIPACYDHTAGDETPFPRVQSDRNGANADFCRVVARLAPSATGTRLKEPRVIVMGTRFNRQKVRDHELVAQLWARTVQAWEAGQMLAYVARTQPKPIYVHTGTLSDLVKSPSGPPDGRRRAGKAVQFVAELA